MADIRINALPTTATDFASDDYIAIDGTTNGTRKLNAKTANLTFSDVTLGASGPSVKSTLSARAPRQGLVFDGSGYSNATLTSQIGTSAATFTAFLKVPSAATAANQYIGYVGASFVNEFDIRIGTGGELDVLLFGSSSSNFNKWSWSSFISSYANKSVHFALVRDTSGNPKIYVNGIDITSSGSFTSGGTPPTWQGTIAGTGTGFGFNYVGVHYGLNIYNRALSASEVVALYEAGAPAGADYNSAGQTLPITGYNLSGVTNLGGGVYQFNAAGNIFSTTSVVKKGKQYTAVFNVDAISGATIVIWNGTGFTNTGITTTGLKSFTYTAQSDTTFGMLANGGTMTISAIAPYGLGLLLAPDAAQAGGGLVWYDTSGNAANITLPASGVSWNVPSSRVLGGNWTTNGTSTINSGESPSAYNNINASAQNLFHFAVQRSGSSKGYIGLDSGDNLALFASNATKIASFFNATGNMLIASSGNDGGQKLQVSGNAEINGTAFGAYNLSVRDTGSTAVGGAYRVYNASNSNEWRWGMRDNGGSLSSSLSFSAGDGVNPWVTALSLSNTGNATFAGKATATQFVATAGSSAGGSVWASSGAGLIVQCKTGSVQDFVLTNPGATSNVFEVPTGTVTMKLGGALRLNNAYTAGAPTATGYVTIQDSAGNTYKVLVGT